MINFSRLHLAEDAAAREAEKASAEKANQGGEKQINDTQRRKDRQKAQMATQQSTPMKSDVAYTSEEHNLRTMKELYKMRRLSESDWREEIMEASKPDDNGDHPFVDVMPFADHKMRDAKKQLATAAKEGGKQAKAGSEVPMDEQFIQEKADSTYPDDRGLTGPEFFARLDKQRAKQKKEMKKEEMTLDQHQEMMKNRKPVTRQNKPLTRPKDTRTDAQKMTDATGPRPGSRYRGD